MPQRHWQSEAVSKSASYGWAGTSQLQHGEALHNMVSCVCTLKPQ